MPELKTPEVARLFNRSPMTIFLWRQGTPQHPEPLPCKVRVSEGGRSEVTYQSHLLKAWAKRNGLSFGGDARSPRHRALVGKRKAPQKAQKAPSVGKRKSPAARPRAPA